MGKGGEGASETLSACLCAAPSEQETHKTLVYGGTALPGLLGTPLLRLILRVCRHSSEVARLSAAGRDFGHRFDPRLGSHLDL